MAFVQSASTGIIGFETNEVGQITRGRINSVPPAGLDTTAATYAVGCEIIDSSTAISYKNTGTVAAPVWSRGGSSAVVDPMEIQLSIVPITVAAMIDTTAAIGMSATNGLTIVPAATTGYVNVWHRTIVSYTYATAAYTGGGNNTVCIGGGGAALSGLIATTTLWQNAANIIQVFVPLSVVAAPMTTAAAISLKTASAITNPGTAAGTAKVYTWYSQVEI
jgi:hypothetical protein